MSETCSNPHRSSYYHNRVCPVCGAQIPPLIGPAPIRAPIPPAETDGILQVCRDRRTRREERVSNQQRAVEERQIQRDIRILARRKVVEANCLKRRIKQVAWLPAKPKKKQAISKYRAAAPKRNVPNEVVVVFPQPVSGALSNPIRYSHATSSLRRGDCDKQDACLDAAVRAGWRGFSCANCSGYVPLAPNLSAWHGGVSAETHISVVALQDRSNWDADDGGDDE